MIRRVAVVVLALGLAASADAAWYALFDPGYVQLRPGESVTVQARGAWLSGIWLVPFTAKSFVPGDPTVATAEGSLPTTAPAPIRVTGHRPGVTSILEAGRPVDGNTLTAPLVVVAERELPVDVSVEGVPALGRAIRLTAVTDVPDAQFTWFQGRLGGPHAWVAGTGRELTVLPSFAAIYEYWVLMVSSDGAGAAGISLEVKRPPSRRRLAGH